MNLIESIEDKFNRLCPDVIAYIRVIAKQGVGDAPSITIFDDKIAPRLKSPLGLSDANIEHFKTLVLDSTANVRTSDPEAYLAQFGEMPDRVDESFGEPAVGQLNQYIADL